MTWNYMKKFEKVDINANVSEMEEKVLQFWAENKTFKKSLEKDSPQGDYIFYDGPPFITGLPHYATLLPSIAKDLVPRYWTMRGYHVDRNWGWDCHGLPAENKVEEQLELKNKKDIEKLGVGKFVDACRTYVGESSSQWKWYIDRIGRWVDMDTPYRTMDLKFMESVIWGFKELYDKGLIYEGYRSSLHCSRCATPLSKFEITMDAGCYRDVSDTSVVVKFKVSGKENTYLLAWTTTPWTLPGNLALAVNKSIEYAEIEVGASDYEEIKKGEKYTLAISALPRILNILTEMEIGKTQAITSGNKDVKSVEYKLLSKNKGKDLVGLEYEPIFDLKNKEINENKNTYKVYDADFVTTEDGTGIVHIAPNFGEDDFEFGKKYDLPIVDLMDENGTYTDKAGDWEGYYFKKANTRALEDLKKKNILFSSFEYTHPYPFCYRCNTPLIYKTQESWYMRISDVREKLLKSNEEINWVPGHFKEKRFKYNIENAPDWSISRSRYWGSPVPVWRCKDCQEVKVVGSLAEIKELSGKDIKDLHRPQIDEVEFKCEKCSGVMQRVPEVLDCWFESGAMPFAQYHYPFEKKEDWKNLFPADFIVEYTGQLRGWFYYLHVLGNSLFDSVAFKNVVVTGVLAGTDGRKMSKSYGNYPDPKMVLEKYGADVLRFYFMSSTIMAGDDMSMSEDEISQIKKGIYRMLWSSYSFFVLYANIDGFEPNKKSAKSENLLDRWIISEMNVLTGQVNKLMAKYEINQATRLFPKFVDDLSNWYIRRSRKRFWKSENDGDKESAYQTLYEVLTTLSKLMAPFTPFISEEIYKNLTGEESVHLTDYPEADKNLIDKELAKKMDAVRRAVELGLAARNGEGIKVRQPLSSLTYGGEKLDKDLEGIISEEVNVKTIIYDPKMKEMVVIDTVITEELKIEGLAREIVRQVQSMRKKAGFNVEDRIHLYWETEDKLLKSVFEKEGSYIAKETLAKEVVVETSEKSDYNEKAKIEGVEVSLGVKRIK
jgi:isoleucyl-tRNA synthetase